MTNHESRGNRFKIWRSKQSHFVNSIITLGMILWDLMWFLIFGIVAMVLIGIAFLWLIQQAANSYSG